MVDQPLAAEPGERIRLFVMNVGPSNTSSFHVVGTIFDRVWVEGNTDNQFRGMQTVLLGSSQGAVVEFVVPEAGTYIMVDHHFANASQGAVGFIRAGQPTLDAEHHNIPATSAVPSSPDAVQGKLAFESKCLACHSLGAGDKLGPDLRGVTQRRTEDWITRFLRDPAPMLQGDSIAQALLARYQVPMPNQNLTEADIGRLIAYFRWADENLAPAP
jgi:nitrite reductase (NO-forming)